MLNSPIKIQKYYPSRNSYSLPKVLTSRLIKDIKEKEENARDEYGDVVEDIVDKDKIIFSAFSWGKNNVSAQSKISSTHSIQIDYFLQSYFGYVKAKR